MTEEETARTRWQERRLPGRARPAPPSRVGRRDETSVRGGAIGVTAVIAATLAISVAGALIAFIVSLLY